MSSFLVYKRIFIGALVVLMLGISIVFRDEISRFLTFDQAIDRADTVVINKSDDPILTEEKPVNGGAAPVYKNVGSVISPIPNYSGRDPAEVRPVPEEIKIFSEEQKKELYAAIETDGRAVKANPDFFYGWINIGISKKVIGDFEGARDAWEYASLIQPKNSLSFSNLGELYWRYLPDFPKSEANFRISILHKPDDWQNYTSLAELYYYSYKEKAELADDVLLEGLRNNPGAGSIMRRLAYLYEQRSEFKKAVEWWEKVLETDPDNAELKEKISKLKVKAGGGS